MTNIDYGEIPLPLGWEGSSDFDGKLFYIDNNTKTTTWIDPRDRYTKPENLADCQGDELPYGLEESHHPNVGTYFIDHINKCNQIEDPRLLWRKQQEEMLREYLVTAEEDLAAKKEIYTVKQDRLKLAQDEYTTLHGNLSVAGWKASASSLGSNASVSSTKHDPDLLRADLALAKNRVSRLKRELNQIHAEMQYKEKGVETLAQVNEKMATQHALYNVDEACAILNEIQKIKVCLSSGEQEKQDLMQTLAKMKEDFLICATQNGSSPDVSTMSLNMERSNTASQTDLMAEYLPKNARLAELTRTRLQYEDAKRTATNLQLQLAKIEDQMIPGQTESDKDRLLLINEKEQLLRELQGIRTKGKSSLEIGSINDHVKKLKDDLNEATETSSRQIADRLKLQEEKTRFTKQLLEATRHITVLEAQLKSLSTSLQSVSSGSSWGSIGSLGSIGSSLSASSKGSLNSISFTDIYGQQSTSNMASDTNIQNLNHRVQKMLTVHHSISPIHEVTQYEGGGGSSQSQSYTQPSGLHVSPGLSFTSQHLNASQNSMVSLSPGSSLSSLSSPPISPYEIGPPPSYEQHIVSVHKQRLGVTVGSGTALPNSSNTNTNLDPVHTRLTELNIGGTQYTQCPRPLASLLPTHQPEHIENSNTNYGAINANAKRPTFYCHDTADGMMTNAGQLSPISETSSGVCNITAGNTRSVSAAVSDESVAGDSGVFEASVKRSGELDDVFDYLNLECAQIQIKIKYEGVEKCLHLYLEQARNLSALAFPENSQVLIKTSLLPCPANQVLSFSTKASSNLNNPKFNQLFRISIAESKLYGKTLQVYVWCLSKENTEELLGCAQVSLNDFDPKAAMTRWYNVLSFKFMASDHSSQQSLVSSGQHSDTSTHMTEDQVTSLLEKSSQKLKNASLNKPLTIVPDEPSNLQTSENLSAFDKHIPHPSVMAVKAEGSSDESTIISSQTSTLTRNQGPDDMEIHTKGELPPGFENPSSTETEDNEEDTTDQGERSAAATHAFIDVPDAISDILEDCECGAEVVDSEGQQLDVLTCDTGVNTEEDFSRVRKVKKRSSHSHSHHQKAVMDPRNSSLRRSQTFSPAGKPSAELRDSYVCKLNRSDSDSSMPLYKRNPFQRNTMERRSLRWKKTPHSFNQKGKSQAEKPHKRTSIDLELDLQASTMKLEQTRDEIERLKELKKRIEDAKAKGGELPSWFTDDEWQQFLQDAEKLIAKQEQNSIITKQDKKVEERLKKAKKEIHKLRKSRKDQADILSFREKMAFFTTVQMQIPVIPTESDSESETESVKQDTLKKSPKKT